MVKTKGVFLIFGLFVVAAALVVAACTGSQGPQGPEGERGPQGEIGPQGSAGTAPTEADLKELIQKVLAVESASPQNIAHGGRIYDNWPKEIGAPKPTENQPLWALQTTNKRTGVDTWRCKECHGWDYKGKGGSYASGSHYTGFPGVLDASNTMTREQLVDIMKGAKDFRHDFTEALGDEHIGHVADFLKQGLINTALYVDYTAPGIPLVGAEPTHGKPHYDTVCALCHGADGKTITIEGGGIGVIAREEPTVEILHKIRAGQPGTTMPSAIVSGWSVKDVVDVLSYVQTLPE